MGLRQHGVTVAQYPSKLLEQVQILLLTPTCLISITAITPVLYSGNGGSIPSRGSNFKGKQ